MKTQQEKIINKFEDLSLKHHKLSLLFNELSKSLEIKNMEIAEAKLSKDELNHFEELLK